MATLTIKPTAAGNDVQIKSGDGNTTHATFGDTNNISMSTGSIASAVTGTLGSGIIFPAGHVLQVKSFVTTSQVNMNSSSYQATGLSCAITPGSTSNKVWITICPDTFVSWTGSKYPIVTGELKRGSTQVHTFSHYEYAGTSGNNYVEIGTSSYMQFLDSPSTVSEVTYTVNAKRDADINYYWKANSTITLMEIAV